MNAKTETRDRCAVGCTCSTIVKPANPCSCAAGCSCGSNCSCGR